MPLSVAKNLVPLTSRFFRMPKKKTQADFRARRWAFFCQPFRPSPPQVVPGRQPKAKGMVPLRQVQVVDYRSTSLWCHTSEPYQTPVSDSRQQRNHIEEAKRLVEGKPYQHSSQHRTQPEQLKTTKQTKENEGRKTRGRKTRGKKRWEKTKKGEKKRWEKEVGENQGENKSREERNPDITCPPRRRQSPSSPPAP